MRQNSASMLRARALPTSVLPTPGTSSSSTCSPDSSATTHRRTTRGLPRTTLEMLFSNSPTRLYSSGAMPSIQRRLGSAEELLRSRTHLPLTGEVRV